MRRARPKENGLSLCLPIYRRGASRLRPETWDRFKKKFSSNRVFQFTATPYRNDGRHVGGRSSSTTA